MSKIFISYQRQSESIAKDLADDLVTLDHKPWFDQALKGGQAWWDEILGAIRDCEIFVFLVDAKSLDSIACQREYSYATDLAKHILPILVAEGISPNLLPPALSKIQWVDYRQQDRNSIRNLVKSLKNLPSVKPLPEPLPKPPEIPISYINSLAEKINADSLDYNTQSTLFLDLKRCLKETETANDAEALFKKLRKHPKLSASIAEEIDGVLASLVIQQPNLPTISFFTALRKRLIGALLAFVLGLALSIPFTISTWGWEKFEKPVQIVVLAIGAAIAILLGGTQRQTIVWISVGAGIGGVLFGSFFGILHGGAFGYGTVGAALGAIIGAFLWMSYKK